MITDEFVGSLGQISPAIKTYSPAILHPIARALLRKPLGIEEKNLPFVGVDIWNHYEVSWLDYNAKPHIAIMQLTIPCTSPYIIESKSLKLYFHGFNNYKLSSQEELCSIVIQDLSRASGVVVHVTCNSITTDQPLQYHCIDLPNGISLDDIDIVVPANLTLNASILQLSTTSAIISESLYTNLFRANCPITNQPDWATVSIQYTGAAISHPALLLYLLAFRQHNDFHEHCIECIFYDIQRICSPQVLTVSAYFTRRGGIDINPMRSTHTQHLPSYQRLVRQ